LKEVSRRTVFQRGSEVFVAMIVAHAKLGIFKVSLPQAKEVQLLLLLDDSFDVFTKLFVQTKTVHL